MVHPIYPFACGDFLFRRTILKKENSQNVLNESHPFFFLLSFSLFFTLFIFHHLLILHVTASLYDLPFVFISIMPFVFLRMHISLIRVASKSPSIKIELNTIRRKIIFTMLSIYYVCFSSLLSCKIIRLFIQYLYFFSINKYVLSETILKLISILEKYLFVKSLFLLVPRLGFFFFLIIICLISYNKSISK